MKTDVIVIAETGEGFDQLLLETERAAAYRGLTPKQALRLRLLAEEMTGMLRTLIGKEQFRFWVETEGKTFALHLTGKTLMNTDLKRELLNVSTSGKNEAAKGFMGRIREIFTAFSEANSGSDMPVAYGCGYVGITGYDASMDMSPNAMLYGWSLKAYRDAVAQNKEQESEKWDELEKSITAKLADDIKIFIRGNTVELVIEKTF